MTATAECRLPGDLLCDPILGCPDEVGCNACGCCGDDYATCRQVFCSTPADGGDLPREQTPCVTRADCPSDESCVYEPGCPMSHGRCSKCQGSAPCGSAVSVTDVCDCSGRTVRVTTPGCYVQQPYRHAGACH